MTDTPRPRFRVYPSASASVEAAKHFVVCPQTEDPAYRLAFADQEFMVSDETRAVRLQLEWQKFDLLLERAGIEHTMVLFGSARTPHANNGAKNIEQLEKHLEAYPHDVNVQQELTHAKALQRNVKYYDAARQLAYRIASESEQAFGFASTIITGGGGGIMEAANRGAFEAGKKSIGLNIVLPHEQHPNAFITPELCFQFHYFAIRKMHFLMRARAVVAFPGGFGTLDELFETLTLRQTCRIASLPIVLYGESYWRNIINFDALVEAAVIGKDDLKLFRYADTVEEAFNHITKFYHAHPVHPVV